MEILFPSIDILLLSKFDAHTSQLNFRGMDSMYIPHHCITVADWILTMIDIITGLIQSCTQFYFATLWIPHPYLVWPVPDKYISCFRYLAVDWTHRASSCNSATYGDSISATRICFKISRIDDKLSSFDNSATIPPISSYGLHLDQKK